MSQCSLFEVYILFIADVDNLLCYRTFRPLFHPTPLGKEFHMQDYLFILGAADPEMNAIFSGLVALSKNVQFAEIDGVRVHAGNAYKADTLRVPEGYMVVTVECAVAGTASEVRIDHHQEGDAGYGLPADRYFDGSSIGQLINFLVMEGESRQVVEAAFGGMSFIKLVAASDHCPAHALKGKCPGVSAEDVLQFRAENKATFLKKDVAVIVTELKEAAMYVASMPRITVGEWRFVNAIGDQVDHFPDALMALDLAGVYQMADRDGRIKQGIIGCTTPEMVTAWMAAQEGVLVDVYGDPVRGYAGGYLPA